MNAVRVGRSRRRPVKTTGTLPPEGSGAAMDSGHTLPIRQWPITLVLAVVGIGLAVTVTSDFRYGLLTIGAGLLLGAVLRALVPEVGLLAVRSRFTDVLVLLFLGAVIVLLALIAQPDPWLQADVLEHLGKFIGRRH
ncbi:DUF3017 domain-containing protein [Kitasatospora mediocidica]|uniref:DUF3017 domain-containing protein n=1 Tax=Kitasatospora mediocidica TaxID=58352 RepID=UPI000563AF62|nr:DUF3017 domain-containing protein [Kitasatospora mediocidica]